MNNIKNFLKYLLIFIIFIILITLYYFYIDIDDSKINNNIEINKNSINLVEKPKTVKEKQKQIFKELEKEEDVNIDYKKIKNEQLNILENL